MTPSDKNNLKSVWITNVCSCLLGDRWQLAQGPTEERESLNPEKNEVTQHSACFPTSSSVKRDGNESLLALQEESAFWVPLPWQRALHNLPQTAKLPYLASQSSLSTGWRHSSSWAYDEKNLGFKCDPHLWDLIYHKSALITINASGFLGWLCFPCT